MTDKVRIGAYAASLAAGFRDGLRTAQYHARDMRGVDATGTSRQKPTILSRAVAVMARRVDGGLSRAADLSVQAIYPTWRDLPSPFEPAVRGTVMKAIAHQDGSFNSIFTAYFFRAARHILERWTKPPMLVLEHRIEGVRSALNLSAVESGEPSAELLAEVLMRLVAARPIARIGAVQEPFGFMAQGDPNVPVMAAASLALLLAQDGKPSVELSGDEFLGITSQLIARRLGEMQQAIAAADVAKLAAILNAVRESY